MAYVLDELEDDQTPGEDAPVIASAGDGSGQAGKAGAAPVALEQPTQSTKSTPEVVDTASYLAANRPQAESLAGLLSGKIQSEQSQLQQDIPTAIGDYKQNVESGRTPFDEQTIQQAALDPTKFSADPGNVEKFTKQRTAEYTGPGSIGEQDFYTKLESRLSGAERRPGQVETEKGRESLLYELGGSNPTAGQVTLDQLLLSQTQPGRQKLKESAAGVQGVRDQFGSLSKEAEEGRTGAIGEAARARDAVQQAFYGEQGVAPQFQQELTGRLEQTRAQQTDASKAAIQDLLDGGPLSAQNAQYLGITSPEAHQEFLRNIQALQQDYGTPLGIESYLNQYTAEGKIPGLEAVSNYEDLAKQKALQQLLGEDYMAPLREDQFQGGVRPDQRLAQFNEPEANRQAQLALMQADESLLQNGYANVWNLPQGRGGPMGQTPIYEDVPEVHQLYNALQRNPSAMADPNDPAPSTSADIYRKFAEQYEQQFGATQPGGDAFTPEPSDASPWQQGQSRTRIVEGPEGGAQKWWDGGNWVDAPSEFLYRDAAGNQTDPQNRTQTYQFDYNTGQYNLIEEVPGGGDGATSPGVFRAF